MHSNTHLSWILMGPLMTLGLLACLPISTDAHNAMVQLGWPEGDEDVDFWRVGTAQTHSRGWPENDDYASSIGLGHSHSHLSGEELQTIGSNPRVMSGTECMSLLVMLRTAATMIWLR